MTGIVLIFTIIQIMVEVFPENKISVFIGGIIAYIITGIIFSKKLNYEMRKFVIKYDKLTKRFEKLGININKIKKTLSC